MIDFFTKLFTPIFIGLGLVSAPVELPPEPQIQVEQQEIQRLQDRIKELEEQQIEEMVELEPAVEEVKNTEEEKVVPKPKPVKVVQEKVVTTASKKEVVAPIVVPEVVKEPEIDIVEIDPRIALADEYIGYVDEYIKKYNKLNKKVKNLIDDYVDWEKDMILEISEMVPANSRGSDNRARITNDYLEGSIAYFEASANFEGEKQDRKDDLKQPLQKIQKEHEELNEEYLKIFSYPKYSVLNVNPNDYIIPIGYSQYSVSTYLPYSSGTVPTIPDLPIPLSFTCVSDLPGQIMCY